jgi:hypothetical protein
MATRSVKTAAKALGKLGGSVKSTAKTATARENGKKGGRPRIVLSAPCWAVGINARTGQAIDEGLLAIGTRLRRLSKGQTEVGPRWTFEASTDEGRSWFKQESFEAPKTKETT